MSLLTWRRRIAKQESKRYRQNTKQGGEMNARQAHLINQERERLQNQLGTAHEGFCVRCVTAVARSILLNGDYFYNGRRCAPKAKSLGAGVYEVWLETPKVAATEEK